MIAWRWSAAVLLVVPLLTASCIWIWGMLTFDAVSRALDKAVLFSVIAGGLAVAGVIAHRQGAGGWTFAWVIGAGASGFAWLVVLAFVVLGLTDDGGGCPGGRVYC